MSLRKILNVQTWDGGLIKNYIQRPTVKAYAYTLPTSKSILNLWTHKDPLPIADTVERLLLWLGVPDHFTVNLWMCDTPRHIAADEWPSRLTVNGGWAVPNQPEIFVYREEEYERVLLHESIHALGWDWPLGPTPPSCWGVSDGQLQPHLFEAWTECYAEWLFCAYYNIPWTKQLKWQQKQALQILSRAPVPWNEDTNVFAYYIVKAALAPHIAFLLPFQTGKTDDEKMFVLCGLVSSSLERMREKAEHITPSSISLRMSFKNA